MITAVERVAPAHAATERVRWLVDNADSYEMLLDAVARARRSIWICQLAFDADARARAPNASDASGSPLLDALVHASRERGVAVRILLNATVLLNTASPLRAVLRDVTDADVRVRGIARFPQLLHAKMLLVDEQEAIMVGSPFVNGYWDDASHRPADPHRPDRELGGRPLHDVSVHLTGSAVRSLSAIFAVLWKVSIGDDDHEPLERIEPRAPVRASHADGSAIRVARTLPRGLMPDAPRGATEILAAITSGIASARELVYVEHQYLSSRRVVAALVAALHRAPELEVVIVLNQNPDVTAYRRWQNARLTESGLLTHPRVGVFTLWRASASALDASRWSINQLFVHSKVLIVDDQWLTTGSANLDGVSLHSYGHDFRGRLGRRLFGNVRNVDVNVVIHAERCAEQDVVRSLRWRLWCEHLASVESEVADRPADGWLSLWRARAAESRAALAARPPVDAPHATMPILLPYSTAGTPRRQLREAGIDDTQLDVRFDPGWLEVHASPSWVRNMFE